MNPNERTLELDKILELLANEAANDLTREQARHLQPQTDLAVVQAELEKTDSALALAVQFGTPPFYAFQDMCTSLQRAKSGAKLSLKDLLEIARILRQVQALSDWYDHWTICSADLLLFRSCWKSLIAAFFPKRN